MHPFLSNGGPNAHSSTVGYLVERRCGECGGGLPDEESLLRDRTISLALPHGRTNPTRSGAEEVYTNLAGLLLFVAREVANFFCARAASVVYIVSSYIIHTRYPNKAKICSSKTYLSFSSLPR